MKKLSTFESLQCIWMSSGLIDYKLCDRNFDCDHCIFEKAMKNTFHKVNEEDLRELKSTKINIVQETIDKIGNCNFKSNYFYMSNGIAAKNLFDDTYYIGFSPVIIPLLDNYTSFESIPEVNNVLKGDNIIEIRGEWGNISLSSPVNFKWLGRLPVIKESGFNEKWFGLVEIFKEDIEKASVSVSGFHRDIINITKELGTLLLESPDVGETMMDGGKEIRFLYQSIGKEKYKEILCSYFNVSYK